MTNPSTVPTSPIDQYNVVWTTQSIHSGESMPCGGGDIGLNVWVEDDELLFYMDRAGCRDENGALLKPWRCRIKLTPNPFEKGSFHQELKLREGHVLVAAKQADGSDLEVTVWVDVFRPIIEQAVLFYDEHYRFRCRELTGKELDNNGKLAIFPANTLEDHWDARNPTSVIAGLTRVLSELYTLPEKYFTAEKKSRWRSILTTLPDMPRGVENGKAYLKPTENHDHRNWVCPEMYPLFPYELYGVGLPDLDLMKQTSLATGSDRFETDSWQQANILAARLGDTVLARDLNAKKMDDGPYRYPAFWPETIDWAPDHNWGGSGMIGMQEMLMQTHSAPGERGKIRLLPAWPVEWDVDFNLHAPDRTTVEGEVRSGKITCLRVTPKARRDDVIVTNTLA